MPGAVKDRGDQAVVVEDGWSKLVGDVAGLVDDVLNVAMELGGFRQAGPPGQGGSGQGEAGQGRPEAVVELASEPAALLFAGCDQPCPGLPQLGQGAGTVRAGAAEPTRAAMTLRSRAVKPDSPRRGDRWRIASSSPR